MSVIPDIFGHLHVHRGLPVPYIACWSAEMTPEASRLTRWLGMDWITTHRPGDGTPDFGSTNSQRQRAGMVKRRCQICGRREATLFVILDASVTP